MNRKGAEWIAWVLATALFVSLSVMLIIWAKGRTTEMTESTVSYIEGKEECKLIVVAVEKSPDCINLRVENKGTLAIEKFVVRIDDNPAESREEDGMMPQEAIDLSNPSANKKVELLPVIEISKGRLAGCTAKRLVVTCA